MKNIIILALICLVVFMYLNKGNVDYVKELKQFPAEIEKLTDNFKDPVKRNRLKVEVQKALNSISAKYHLPQIPITESKITEDTDTDIYLSIELTTGFKAEGKFLSKTPDGDYILLLPGSKITVAHDRIASVTEITGEDRKVLQDLLAEAQQKRAAYLAHGPLASVDDIDVPIEWQTDLPEALKMADVRGMRVMIDFYADWCGWCKKMDTETFADKDVRRLLRKYFICVKINGDNNRSIAAQYRVQGYPNFVFLTSSGQVIYQQPGYMPPESFMQLLETIVKR